jgi:hypothetical protein
MTNREIKYLVINIPVVIVISYLLTALSFSYFYSNKWKPGENEKALLLFTTVFLLDIIILILFKIFNFKMIIWTIVELLFFFAALYFLFFDRI